MLSPFYGELTKEGKKLRSRIVQEALIWNIICMMDEIRLSQKQQRQKFRKRSVIRELEHKNDHGSCVVLFVFNFLPLTTSFFSLDFSSDSCMPIAKLSLSERFRERAKNSRDEKAWRPLPGQANLLVSVGIFLFFPSPQTCSSEVKKNSGFHLNKVNILCKHCITPSHRN